MKKTLLFILLAILFATSANAQKASIGTNIIGYANLLTINAEASYAVAQNWTVSLQGKYNPWTFNERQPAIEHMQSRQLTFAAGARYWPWHVYSGWFVGSHLQWTKYNWGGIVDDYTYEGYLHGVGFNAGYSLMMNKKWNIEFGLGVLVGPTNYTKYSCPSCGKILEKDKKIYVGLNNVLVQLAYLF